MTDDSTGVIETAGISIPRIGLGTFRTTPDEAHSLVLQAIDVGYRHFDTAILYENESGVGRAVRDSSVPREEIFVTTKLPRTAASATDAVAAARSSLKTLDLGYIDLLLLHWPSADVPPEETFQALTPLVADGVIRAVGMSNAPAALVRRALTVTHLANLQVEHHPYLPQETLHALVDAEDMTLTAYSPLAEGRVLSDPVMISIAEKHGRTAAQVSLRWLLSKPRTVVIPKTATPSRLASNINVLDFELDPEDIAQIDALGAARLRFFDPPVAAGVGRRLGVPRDLLVVVDDLAGDEREELLPVRSASSRAHY